MGQQMSLPDHFRCQAYWLVCTNIFFQWLAFYYYFCGGLLSRKCCFGLRFLGPTQSICFISLVHGTNVLSIVMSFHDIYMYTVYVVRMMFKTRGTHIIAKNYLRNRLCVGGGRPCQISLCHFRNQISIFWCNQKTPTQR